MSSDEAEGSSPVLPKDSDGGSSVSSALQDEYEELLRYAVVTPKFEVDPARQPRHASQAPADGRIAGLMDATRSRPLVGSTAKWAGERLSSSEVPSAGVAPREHSARVLASAEEMPIRASVVSAVDLEEVHSEPESSGSSIPEPGVTAVTEMFVSEEQLSRMEQVLDTWSDNLKVHVMAELRKWKLVFMEQHRLELKRERQRHAAQVARLSAQTDSLKELLRTYETSNQRKDEVISNLSHSLERQRERLELMRTFTHWRLQHLEAKEEAHAAKVAEQHYLLQLKRKVWAAWRSPIQARWKQHVERACQARAEAVCAQLSANHEAQLAQCTEELEEARGEIRRLHAERERFEESMKKAFMRGVCALNMEAMSVFQGAEARPDHDLQPAPDAPRSSSSVCFQPQPNPPARSSPVHFESATPPSLAHDDADPASQFMSQSGSGAGPFRSVEGFPSTTSVSTVLPPGGAAATHKQPGTRVVTSAQQKAAKTITARITGRPDLRGRASRVAGSLQVMGVDPPMSSVIVERHHPVTQLTVSQATAAKFPRSSQGSAGGRGPAHHGRAPTSQIHSIKLVE
ncbi:centrosomal protein POC5 [Paramormyrops kingsleyae]|uniref:Centrosomal protein POC5 n=1 Tax=Paramormyrops kingsleyae TaxID=1676925 RepID=A0A3B3R0I5_9TELE|nr:centrosomal protein POC5 [Paramormyrops kingsleyae]XP_023678725.1 centrosomal protein POC5 [Paramormyrops kingsleyae]XP_023678727.1 centrosomal protein POC5 [Paramormyrops kingsleyae]XP_023678728.1 centrosomal protein POC5 [Paramormyrops kingsleyae]